MDKATDRHMNENQMLLAYKREFLAAFTAARSEIVDL